MESVGADSDRIERKNQITGPPMARRVNVTDCTNIGFWEREEISAVDGQKGATRGNLIKVDANNLRVAN